MRTLYVEFVLTSACVHTDCNVDDTPPHLSYQYKSLAKVFLTFHTCGSKQMNIILEPK